GRVDDRVVVERQLECQHRRPGEEHHEQHHDRGHEQVRHVPVELPQLGPACGRWRCVGNRTFPTQFGEGRHQLALALSIASCQIFCWASRAALASDPVRIVSFMARVKSVRIWFGMPAGSGMVVSTASGNPSTTIWRAFSAGVLPGLSANSGSVSVSTVDGKIGTSSQKASCDDGLATWSRNALAAARFSDLAGMDRHICPVIWVLPSTVRGASLTMMSRYASGAFFSRVVSAPGPCPGSKAIWPLSIVCGSLASGAEAPGAIAPLA